MDKWLRRGIIIVFITNIINLLFSLITNFILPKYLSVDLSSIWRKNTNKGTRFGFFSFIINYENNGIVNSNLLHCSRSCLA